jgi:hypothetical protein
MDEATQGNIRVARMPGGNVTLEIHHGPRFVGCLDIQRADLDDAIAALQALRGDWRPTVGGAVEAMNIARAGQKGIVARNQGGRLPWVVRHPDGCETGYAAHEIRPWSELRPVARRPIERYVRAAVAIPGSKGRADGTIEIGLHYDPSGDQPGRLRDSLLRCGDLAVRSTDGEHLDENIADAITANLDQRIVDIWGDRPRFIEVWRGTGDDAEPLTQVYAPHGMPIGRTT